MKKLCGLLSIIVLTQTVYGFGFFNSKPYLTPTSSPTNSIYINWNTECAESSIVAYGLTESLGDTMRMTGIRNYHHVELTGLSPGTQYFYRVLPDGDLKTFKTYPVFTDTFAFVAFGDTRSDSVAHQSVIDCIAAYEYEPLVHVGDMVYDGNSTSDWRTYFNIEDTLLQSKVFLPVIGNHESPFWPYDTLFALPGAEDYYSVSYGNSRFVILNTEMDLYGAQHTWLINDLTAANNDTTIDWIFVCFHRPPYSSGNHGSQTDVRNAWCPLFEQYDVDIVFAGHDHDYERTIPINEVVYIVTGGGGAPLRHVDSSSWTAYSESTYQFCHIEIENRNLILRAIKPDGTVFDSLFISKPVGIIEEQNLIDNDSKITLEIKPNPFANKTEIHFGKEHPDGTGRLSYGTHNEEAREMSIYDIMGNKVKNFNLPTAYSSVPAAISWDGKDDTGHELPGGVYFLKYLTDDLIVTEKIILIRE